MCLLLVTARQSAPRSGAPGADGAQFDAPHAAHAAQVLDAALLRPGRFDRRVTVERPDRTGREQILRVHIARRALPLADDVSVTGIASSTTGFTGADLANLVNEAALLAGRSSKGAPRLYRCREPCPGGLLQTHGWT